MSEISLQKQLQKTFQVLESVVCLWEKTLADCACTVAATTNLCEQYFDCKSLAVETLPVGKILPDVQERLLYKILSELDRKVADLRDKLLPVLKTNVLDIMGVKEDAMKGTEQIHMGLSLRAAEISFTLEKSAVKEEQDKFSKHQEQCVKLYKRHSNELDVYKITESTAMWPSMSTMLEVLVDSDCLLFDLYNLKMHWIEQLSEEKTLNCETLTHSWSSGDKDILQNLKDYLCHLTFFVQERV